MQVRGTGRPVSVPLPPPRPENLQPRNDPSAADRADGTGDTPSACRARFAERGGVVLPQEAKNGGEGECVIADPVSFRQIAVPDGPPVALETVVTVSCAFALELLDWVRVDLPAVLPSGSGRLVKLTSVGGQACRPRNGVPGAFISEHATGNALDLGGLVLQDGRTIRLTEPDGATRALREAVQQSACRRFRTVLGPGSDSAHKDHIHLDMRQRNRDHRICQWTVD